MRGFSRNKSNQPRVEHALSESELADESNGDLHFSPSGHNSNITVVSCIMAHSHYAEAMGERRYHVYIVASRTRVLYVGFTGNIEVRMQQHKAKTFEGFTGDYNCNRLVWYESYDNPNRPIDREKQIKRWTRAKKLALIDKMNPTWVDLSEDWGTFQRMPTALAIKQQKLSS